MIIFSDPVYLLLLQRSNILNVNFIFHITLPHKRISRNSFLQSGEDEDVMNDDPENNKGNACHKNYIDITSIFF